MTLFLGTPSWSLCFPIPLHLSGPFSWSRGNLIMIDRSIVMAFNRLTDSVLFVSLFGLFLVWWLQLWAVSFHSCILSAGHFLVIFRDSKRLFWKPLWSSLSIGSTVLMLAVGASRSALIFMHLLIYFCPALNLELPPDWSIDTGLFLHQNAAKSIQKSLPCRLMHRVEDATGLRPWLSCCDPRPAFKDSWWRDLHLRTARHKNGRRASCICLLTCRMPSLST